jgi:hypothetical protein
MTVGQSSFLGRAPGNWSAIRESALLWSARVAATPRGASYSAELVALSAAGDPQREAWPSFGRSSFADLVVIRGVAVLSLG